MEKSLFHSLKRGHGDVSYFLTISRIFMIQDWRNSGNCRCWTADSPFNRWSGGGTSWAP